MKTPINFTRIKNDINGNPRYVCHFLDLLTADEQNQPFQNLYPLAIKKAKTIGGKKYHTKNYGGGIVFQSYNIDQTEKNIKELINQK